MDVLVPFDAIDPKRRLEPVLGADERHDFAEAMLADVLEAVAGGGGDPRVVATADVRVAAPVDVDERPLSPAVNDRLARADRPLAIVMADLPLATPTAIARLLEASGPVVAVPGLGGGTNALVVREPAFRVDYHGCSIRDHRERAAAVGTTLTTVDSYRLGVDVDEPADLAEVLLHAEGRARAWLEAHGVRIVHADGRVSVERSPGD
ncbi:MAG: 2-phospho-L-lactate guanylyltransferase [Halobacteriales archaeon]